MAEYGIIPGTEPSLRVQRLKENFLDRAPCMCCDRAVIYTEVYQQWESLPVIRRRARALRETLTRMPVFISPGEIIVGHPASKPRSAEVFPEINIKFMEDIEQFETREYNRLRVSAEVKQTLYDMWPYWKGKTLTDLFFQMRPAAVRSGIATGLLSNTHEWSGFAHVAMDYRKILHKGIAGIQKEIGEYRKNLAVTDPEFPRKSSFYAACEELCEGTLVLARRYRTLALEMAAVEEDAGRAAELRNLAELLERSPLEPAANFREAVQSFWFMQLIPQIESNGFSISPGRFDQYMWPFLERDLSAGKINFQEAQELVDMLFLKFAEIMRVDSTGAAEVNAGYASGQNLVVGGIDAAGNDCTNPLSYICLTANYHIRLHQPNFTVRLHKNTPADFLNQVILSISGGNGMPQVLNDGLIIRSLTDHGIPLEEAREYLPVGCDEITVHGMWGRCNGGYLNMAKALEMTIGCGTDLEFNKEIGLRLDADGCDSFEDFMRLFEKQLSYSVELQVCDANLADHIHQQIMPLPFISLFMDDCLQRGQDVTGGGARYNTTGLVAVGAATCADSLYAIRDLVFENKKLSLREFREKLAHNFNNDEYLRQFIINRLPKFGNDVDGVDSLAVRLTGCFFDNVESYKNYRGGAFWPALYSVSAQIGLGNYTAATADGRLANLPLSDGLTPMYGLDLHGPTADLKSVTKINQSRAPNGVIINQRLTKNLFVTPQGREKMAQLLRYFVDSGSFHWQFNILDNQTLLKAQKTPEEYRSLVVRVAGYSAIFVELSRKAQDSIIGRYEGTV